MTIRKKWRRDNGLWVMPLYDRAMQEAATEEVRNRLRRARDSWLRHFKLPVADDSAAAPAKRKYNMTPEGTAAKSVKMKEYWRKKKASS
jgi:hypothetical protein